MNEKAENLIQIAHWVAYLLTLWLLYIGMRPILKQRLGMLSRGAISLFIGSLLFIFIEAMLLKLPSKGIVYWWQVGAAGDFYIYVLFMLIAVSALAVSFLKHLLEKHLS